MVEEQHVLLDRSAHERDAQHQVGGQVEGRGPLFADQRLHLRIAGRRFDRREVDAAHVHRTRRLNDLHGRVVRAAIDGAQHLVPLDDRVERALERIFIETAAQAQRRRDVVLRAAPFELVDEPEPC